MKLSVLLGAPPPEKCAIRQSSIATLEQCHRKGYLEQVQRLRPLKFSPALGAGSYAHAFASDLLAGVPEEKAIDVQVRKHRVVIAEYQSTGHLDAATELKALTALNKGLAIGSKLNAAIREWGTVTPIATEYEIRGPIPEMYRGREASGRLDLLVRDNAGRYWVIDLKTTSGSVGDMVLQIKRKMQPYHYTYLLRSHIGSEEWKERTNGLPVAKVVGFLHVIVRTPGIRRKGIGTAKEQTLSDYIVECEEWWTGTGRWLKNAAKWTGDSPIQVHRHAIPESMPAWVRARLRRYAQTIRHLEGDPDLDDVLPSERACCPSPQNPCPFLPLCDALDDEDRNRITMLLREKYSNTPDPLANQGNGDDEDEGSED